MEAMVSCLERFARHLGETKEDLMNLSRKELHRLSRIEYAHDVLQHAVIFREWMENQSDGLAALPAKIDTLETLAAYSDASLEDICRLEEPSFIFLSLRIVQTVDHEHTKLFQQWCMRRPSFNTTFTEMAVSSWPVATLKRKQEPAGPRQTSKHLRPMRHKRNDRVCVPEQGDESHVATDFRDAEALLALSKGMTVQGQSRNEATAQNDPDEETAPQQVVLSRLEYDICFRLAQFKVLGIISISRTLLASLVGYTCINSNSFSKAFGRLGSHGYISPQSSHVSLRNPGWNAIQPRKLHEPRNNEEVHANLRTLLREIAGMSKKSMPKIEEIFDILADGRVHRREDVANDVGYSCQQSSGFAGAISTMKALRLIENNSPEYLKLSTQLCFPYGYDMIQDAILSHPSSKRKTNSSRDQRTQL